MGRRFSFIRIKDAGIKLPWPEQIERLTRRNSFATP
jgi:hypothetical protein